MGEALVQGAPLRLVRDDLLADLVDADAPGPFVDALEIAALLAIELHQRADDLERFLLAVRVAERLRAQDVETRRAREHDVVAAVDADHADVLAGRLGAIARAAGDGHLDLRRRPGAPEQAFELDRRARSKSCVPKRHQSVPTQVFTVRRALP